jgi:hypothetical protein
MCQIEGRVPDDSTRSDAAFNNVIMAIVHFDTLFVSGLVCLNLLVSNIPFTTTSIFHFILPTTCKWK